MQGIDATSVRQGNATVRLVNTHVIVQGSSVSSSTGASASQHKAHAVLQQGHGSYSSGQPIIVTIANHHDETGVKTRDISVNQRNNQIIYQTEQSYSDYSQSRGYSSACYQNMDSASMSSGLGGHLLGEGGDSYLIQTNIDTGGGQITHTIRASPVTVQWLLDNYETAETVSLPRSTLYNHYMRHCHDNKLEPMNPASFGKLIRSVFPGLRTRRLGTRGNSQYHYYGIRIKSMSPLNQMSSDTMFSARQQSFGAMKRHKSESEEGSVEASDGSSRSQPSAQTTVNSQQFQHQQYLGEVSSDILPDFGHVEPSEDEMLPEGITQDHITKFENLYKTHCKGFLDIVINLKFPLVETLWVKFWRKIKTDSSDSDGGLLLTMLITGINWNEHINPTHIDVLNWFPVPATVDEPDQMLSTPQLYAICQLPSVQQYVRQSDYSFYQVLVHILVPDVLRPIPSQLTQSIRNFAKNLENWLKTAMIGAPEDIVKIKLTAVKSFAQILRRYTSLNHLAQAARAVLQNSNQITQMLTDLNKVDFNSIQEQASWVCRCEDTTIRHLEQDFKRTLQQLTPLEQWADWLETVVNDSLDPYTTSQDFPKAARQFLLKWSFYSSMVIRDLTLRSAASFGSFHLIRLLYDEYMFFLVEHKVASTIGETSISVMADNKYLLDVDLPIPQAAEPVSTHQRNVVGNGSAQQTTPNGSLSVTPITTVIVKSAVSRDTLDVVATGRTAVILPVSVADNTAAVSSVSDQVDKPSIKRARVD